MVRMKGSVCQQSDHTWILLFTARPKKAAKKKPGVRGRPRKHPKQPEKKRSPHGQGKNTRRKTSPVNGVDIDELVSAKLPISEFQVVQQDSYKMNRCLSENALMVYSEIQTWDNRYSIVRRDHRISSFRGNALWKRKMCEFLAFWLHKIMIYLNDICVNATPNDGLCWFWNNIATNGEWESH